jgi:hypothetical protein
LRLLEGLEKGADAVAEDGKWLVDVLRGLLGGDHAGVDGVDQDVGIRGGEVLVEVAGVEEVG